MNNDRIFRAMGDIDEDLIARAAPKAKMARVQFAPWLKWAMPIAACLVITAAVTLPQIFENAKKIDPNGVYAPAAGEIMPGGGAYIGNGESGLLSAEIETIFGLPTSDYTWDEGEGITADRMATNELRLLMREFDSYDPNVKATFAVVKAESVERFADKYGEGQISDCGVLFDVLGDGIDMPLKIKQHLYGGCTNNEETNLLRVGGVYVLPLVKSEQDEYWRVY
jgi:hypothetical protein